MIHNIRNELKKRNGQSNQIVQWLSEERTGTEEVMHTQEQEMMDNVECSTVIKFLELILSEV